MKKNGKTIECEVCGRSRYVRKSHLGRIRVCSYECSIIRKRNRVDVVCSECGATFSRPKSQQDWAIRRGSRSFYCSISCRRNSESRGRSKTPEYRAWWAIIQRCNNPADSRYKYYGGRGVSVCDRWLRSENFLDDMGPRPSLKHSIDRIDNDGDYCPKNCRWATAREQSRNTRSNVNITYNGKTMCLADWAEELGMNPQTLGGRIGRGWSSVRAIEEPVKR